MALIGSALNNLFPAWWFWLVQHWVNLSKRGGKDGVFQGLAGLRGKLRGAAINARGKPSPSKLYFRKSNCCPTIPFLEYISWYNPFPHPPPFSVNFSCFLQEPYRDSKNLILVYFSVYFRSKNLILLFSTVHFRSKNLTSVFCRFFFWKSKNRSNNSVFDKYRLAIPPYDWVICTGQI